MSGEGMCWCASDVKCPHGISHKIPSVWEDLEKIIDDVLQNFDRKSIRRFLKKTSDPHSNVARASHEAYKQPDDVKTMIEKAKSSEPYMSSPELTGKKRRSEAIESESMLSKTTPLQNSDPTDSFSKVQPLKRPATVAGEKSSGGQLPKIQPTGGASTGFSRDLLSQSLPKLPPRQGLQPAKNAWGTNSVETNSNTKIPSPVASPSTKHPESSSFDDSPEPSSHQLHHHHQQQTQNQQMQKTNPLFPMQADGIISAGLMRIVDQLARVLLPWQAVLCPRAVETLQDLRLALIQSKHSIFMQQMKGKLEDKVSAFMRKKEEEVDVWLDQEIKAWQKFLENDEIDLTEFIKADLERLTSRAIVQDNAYRRRELQIANELDDHERDQTREQLVNFRRIVRASKNPLPGGASIFDQEPKHVEVRTLQETIARAQSSMKTKAVDSTRNTIRKIEESHDWLSSLADNAMTAAISEEKLKQLYSRLDKEKGKSMDALQNALANYKEQHHSILEAITVFAGRIHQHATDYLQREQLVTRAFLQYLLAIISGEIKSHTNEQKKTSYAWETKSLTDRELRKEQTLIGEFHHHINPLDKMVNEFKEKMRIQMDHITMKLQSIVNGKENDINARKALIHRKLAKHVNKACNARRQRLKNATAIRRDEFELESLAMMKVTELCSDLRSSIDSVWVKEHLKERKIYEAAMGRLERLEKSALIIWNKHSHLAIDTKEDYTDWLENYKKDRDLKIVNHKYEIERSYLHWREDIGEEMKQLSNHIRQSFKNLLPKSLVYEIEDPLEKNVTDLRAWYAKDHQEIMGFFSIMKERLETFIKKELSSIDAFNQQKKQELLYEYQSQLVRLDAGINRRIGGLKDMEADLEETIRLTILQHEVENNVFEQLSCARFEKFWIDWSNRVRSLARDLTHTQEDYEVSKRNGKMKSRINRKDRVIDDLVDVAKETAITTGNNTGANKLKSTAETLNNMIQQQTSTQKEDGGGGGGGDAGFDSDLTDTMRIKIILDDIKPELYRDFNHKLTRGIEKVRRDLGEGRKQYVPLYAITKVIALQCDRFYDKTRLNERCIGRISSQGVLLYTEGLPVHAKHKFILGTTLALIAILPVKQYKIDCEDLFAQLENMKVYFMIGLLTIINQYQEFGEYFIRSECMWMCSILEISPPEELLVNTMAKGLKECIPETFEPSGIFSEDPVDVFNSIIDQPTDLEAVEAATRKYQQQLNKQLQQQQQANYMSEVQSVAGEESQLSNSLNDDPSGYYQYNKQPQNIFDDMASYRQLSDTLARLQGLLPLKDCIIFAALLGRADGSMEYTTHRICQVVSIWRRVAVAMVVVTLQPPSTEYPRIQELITSHNASITGRKRVETSNIHCISPFEAISSGIDYLTSIQGLPISILQALALLSKGGNVDPWLEDPKQSFRHERIITEIQDLVELYNYRIPRSMIHNEFLQISFPKSVYSILQSLDLNYSNQMPLESLRTFLQRDDLNLTNGQVSVIFWSLCRQNDDVDGDTKSDGGKGNNNNGNVTSSEGMKTFQTGGGYRPLVATQFYGDPEKYMIRFGEDVDKYLHSMPSIDSNVVIGYLTNPLTNTAAHELVSDAMKLDAAARNPMPATCCVWITSRIIHREDALKAMILPGQISNEGNYLVGVSHHAFALGQLPSTEVKEGGDHKDLNDVHLGFLLKLRAFVEVDILAKYPEISEIRASDRHYGPAGNDPMVYKQSLPEDFHWKELLNRRLQRLDRLTKSWRDTMLSEWAESLYISRQMRYSQRINLIQKSVSVYHTQYHDLREAILQERSGLISLFRGLENELITLIQDDYSLITYHTSFIDRMLRRFEGEYERFWFILKEMMLQYIHHISSIRRYGIQKINLASDRLKADLDASCNGLIQGYTTGYAQGYFDELILRGEIWRKKLTDLQGKLIIIKEHFMFQKDEIDRDLTIQITDRLTANRQLTKSHLQSLNEDSTSMLEIVANTRTSYAALQKDANARLILRIEKAIRESRKLRNAAEQQPEIEEAVLRDIRHVLLTAKNACVKIVEQIKETCLKQLHSLVPVRSSHRQKMEKKVEGLKQLWKDVELVVFPLIDDYEKEITKQLTIMNAKAIEMINIYYEEESSSIKRKYKSERVLLIESFRKHFREYDLNELVIFERFNTEVTTIVQDMIRLWGPSRPKFITNALKELQTITKESLNSSYRDIRQSSLMRSEISDVIIMSRMELADLYHFHLSKAYDYVLTVPRRFLQEKEETLEFIDEMSLEKNGDMVRPQVKAVMDLLISGIEIDYDFNLGYENLIHATKAKSSESSLELTEFLNRYQSMDYPVSIPQTIDLTKQKIQARKDEVNALLDASNSHMIADHSKLDVLFSAGEKDIEEWTNLTNQLIENAFHNAQLNYLSNLWPTPEPTPRLDEIMIVGEDEDRVGRLKSILAQSAAMTAGNNNNELVPRARSPGYDISVNNNNNSSSTNNLANYTGDMKWLLQNLALSPEEEEEEQRLYEESKAEKQRRATEAKLTLEKAKTEEEVKSQVSDVESVAGKNDFKELKTIELQQGWFECHSPEGYMYYHNPVTQESLWDLPQFLKQRKHDDYDDPTAAAAAKQEEAEKILDTPRELLILQGNMYPNETIPIRVVPESFRLDMKVDRKMIMSEVAEEARALSTLVVDTAVDITKIIHGRRGRDEQTIATLLGERYHPETLKKYKRLEAAAESGKSEYLDRLLAKHLGEEDQEKQEYEQFLKQETLLMTSLEAEKNAHVEEARQSLLNENGLMITDEEHPDQMIAKTNAEVDELLLTLGLGSELERSIVTAGEARPTSTSLEEIVQPDDWLQLGLGEQQTRGDHETESSDGEEYTGYHQKEHRLQRIEELKYLQTKELELMNFEDKLSIAYENYLENENCQLFLDRLSIMKSTNTATEEDKQILHTLAGKIRLINVIEIFQEISLSWEEIDQLIEITIARREREKQLEEEMKTKEGLQRQQYILEHNEDIQEMMKFLVEKAQLSKLLSKKMATELILENIATPKKLAKIWSRKEINLREAFAVLDEDDLEELEKALYSLLLPSSTSQAEMMISPNQSAVFGGGSFLGSPAPGGMHPMSGSAMNLMNPAAMMMMPAGMGAGGGNAMFDPHNTSGGGNAGFPMVMMTPYGSFMTMGSHFDPNNPYGAPNNASASFHYSPTKSTTSLQQYPSTYLSPLPEEQQQPPPPAPVTETVSSPVADAPSHPTTITHYDSNFNLDPSWITKVVEEDDEPTEEKSLTNSATVSLEKENNNEALPTKKSSNLEYKMTKDGYKSFRGGWIEGVSEDNEVYYYNVKTGQSAWHLPDLLAAASEGAGGDNGDNASEEPLSVAFADQYEEDIKQGSVSSQPAAAYDPNSTALVSKHGSHVHFQTDPYSSAHASYYALPTGHANSDPNNALVPTEQYHSDYYYDPNDPNAYHHDYYQDPNSQQYYPPDYSGHEQNLSYNYPYDPNYPDPNGAYYDPNHQQYPTDPNYYTDPSYYNQEQQQLSYDPNYYQQQQHDPYYGGDHYSVGSGGNRSLHSQEMVPYQTDGQWKMSDALGVDHLADYIPPPKPRAIPTYQTMEVITYSKKEGTSRQLILLQTQDRWQNALVKTQQFITEQKTKFITKRQEMFDKVSQRCDNRLNSFVEEIKFMQKLLKKELGDANATERDLRRLFEENQEQQLNTQLAQSSLQSQDILRAEKLSFILESLEKFKMTVSEKYESAFKQMSKFAADWELLKMELLQIGNIFDEGVQANLEQCKLACEHQIKLFVYEQIKQTTQIMKNEMNFFRKSLKKEFHQDTKDAYHARELKRQEQIDYYYHREVKKEELRREYGTNERRFLEKELLAGGWPAIEKEEDMLTEEELVMSYLLTQIEMEASLSGDYESILDASKTMAIELQSNIKEFDAAEKKSVKEEGSWFNKHRETLERHEQALQITLNKVRNRINEGYQILQSKIEALDFDVEKAAEEELYQGSIDNMSTNSSI